MVQQALLLETSEKDWSQHFFQDFLAKKKC